LATQVEFDYGLARFISFRDREACERVRQIKRADLARPSESRVPNLDRR
jgi:hypothetical protein